MASASTGPQLVVISDGPLKGRAYPLRQGEQILGRVDEADITVPHSSISARHARLYWDGHEATVVDAGSRNGSTLNGHGLRGAQPMRAGDVLAVAGLELQFEVPEQTGEMEAIGSAPRWESRFDRVEGDVIQAARDVHKRSEHSHHYGPEDPLNELFQGRGLGRALMAFGFAVALLGFAAWMYLIFAGGSSVQDPGATDPFEDEILGLPVAAVAFGVILVGGVVGSLGAAMSRAAREREKQRRR